MSFLLISDLLLYFCISTDFLLKIVVVSLVATWRALHGLLRRSFQRLLLGQVLLFEGLRAAGLGLRGDLGGHYLGALCSLLLRFGVPREIVVFVIVVGQLALSPLEFVVAVAASVVVPLQRFLENAASFTWRLRRIFLLLTLLLFLVKRDLGYDLGVK